MQFAIGAPRFTAPCRIKEIKNYLQRKNISAGIGIAERNCPQIMTTLFTAQFQRGQHRACLKLFYDTICSRTRGVLDYRNNYCSGLSSEVASFCVEHYVSHQLIK